MHHAQNTVYLDRNYVGVLCLWDHLFGTFQEELPSEPCLYGIRGQLKSWNPVWANLHYYAAMAQDSWHAPSVTDKVKVWFAHPGWRPSDVAARFPKPPYDLARDFHKFDPVRSTALSAYGFVQFLAIIPANSHFLAVLKTQSHAANIGYFVFLMVSLVTLGGLLENRRGFFYAEAARLVLVLVATLGFSTWFGGPHGAATLYTLAGVAATSLLWLAFIRKPSS